MIKENIYRIREQLAECARKSGRRPDQVKLVAVSKKMPASAILEALDAQQFLFGENYVQELQSKREQLPSEISFHFIGHLQSNKARIAAECCTMIETVDRLKIAAAISRHLEQLGRCIDILVQVNVGGESQKSGSTQEDLEALLTEIHSLPALRIRGLMTMPPYHPDPEQSRPHFIRLRQLAEKMQERGFLSQSSPPILSMGMSGDFQVAIEEGANLVRIGTAIFGER